MATPSSKGAFMVQVLYTARAHVVGGRDGHGETQDGALRVNLRRPPEMGGDGDGTNPEQLFAVGYAACFESALASVARRRQLDLGEVVIDSAVSLQPSGDGGYVLVVELNVGALADLDRATASELIRGAHRVCPYSNATRGNIDVVLLLEGEELVDSSVTSTNGRVDT